VSSFKGTSVVGAEEVECQSVSEVFNCLHIGMSNGQVGWAADQQHPYHTHSLFTLTPEQQWIVGKCTKSFQQLMHFTAIIELNVQHEC
jgi:hypothetical protein